MMPPSSVALDVIPQWPHCDSLILHAPEDECEYCNAHPEWQQLRQLWGINFTGQTDPTKTPCPSSRYRTAEQAHKWHGNRPSPGILPPGTKTSSFERLMQDADAEEDYDMEGTVFEDLFKGEP